MPLLASLLSFLIVPDRLFYQPDGAVSISLNASVAQALKVNGANGKLVLIDASGNKLGETEISFDAESIDLSQKLPEIWKQKQAVYVQAQNGDGQSVGSALVVVPLYPPDAQRRVYVTEPFGLRIYPEVFGVMDTTEGEFTMQFTPEYAPNTVNNFMQLIAGGMYTNVKFHRILPGFVIQGGDPLGSGLGGPGYSIDLEASSKKHKEGTLSMARSRDPDSAGSQFFVCLSEEGCVHLNNQYAAFGDVVKGMDVVRKIAATPLSDANMGTPAKAPMIKSAKLIPADPRSVN